MSIRTGKGDNGYTGSFSGKQTGKDSMEIHAAGELDELNSVLGLVKTRLCDQRSRSMVETVQHDIAYILYDISGQSRRSSGNCPAQYVSRIKDLLKEEEAGADIPAGFIIPGDNEISALLHLARAVARRAERAMVSLSREHPDEDVDNLVFMNCLSDLLFIMAVKRSSGEGDT